MSFEHRYVVLGAGGVGCALGGLLQAAGAEVVLIARGAQLDALARRGLAIATPHQEIELVVSAVPSPRALRFEDRDVVLCCAKSQDMEPLFIDLAAAAPRDVPVICAQNGVAAEPIAAAHFPRTYGLVVYSPIQFLSPGRVSIHGAPALGGLDLGLHPVGADDLVNAVVRDLSLAGFDARAEPRIARWKLGKLLMNLGNAVQALARDTAACQSIVAALTAEALAAYRAAGLDFASIDELAARYADVGSASVKGAMRGGGSTWQSLARRTGSIETAFLNGEIVRLGERHGVATPYNRGLVALAERAAREGWAPGQMEAADIEAAIRRGSMIERRDGEPR